MKNIYLISFILILPFFLGYHLNGHRYEHMLDEMQIKAQKQENALKEKIRKLETQHQETINVITVNSKQNLNALQNKYNSLLIELDGLYKLNGQDSSQNNQSMSSTTTATTGVTTTNNCRWNGQNGIDYKKLLDFAKERDAIAIKYNTLLDIYNELYTQYQNKDKETSK